ncbi:MAG: Flp pilus assembly complex ATPase component TadA [Limnobacter sp.]|nr:Flp pilus assembly complex ATPase component TadA [Limnobacter sp.]
MGTSGVAGKPIARPRSNRELHAKFLSSSKDRERDYQNNKGLDSLTASSESGFQITKTKKSTLSGRVIAHPESATLAVQATPSEHRKVQEWLNTIEARLARQVRVEAVIAEVSLNQDYRRGIDWSLIRQGSRTLGLNVQGSEIQNPTFTFSLAGQAGKVDVNLVFRLLEQFGQTTVVSSPRVVTLNQQPAVLKVIDNRVYFTTDVQTTAPTSTNPAFSTFSTKVNTVPVGFLMTVTPQISDDHFIQLRVRPTLSRIVNFVTDPNPALQQLSVVSRVPEVQTRELESLLTLQDGELALLGGLRQTTLQNSTSGIPGTPSALYPVLQSEADSSGQTELVILLQASEIPLPSGNKKQVTKNRAFHFAGAGTRIFCEWPKGQCSVAAGASQKQIPGIRGHCRQPGSGCNQPVRLGNGCHLARPGNRVVSSPAMRLPTAHPNSTDTSEGTLSTLPALNPEDCRTWQSLLTAAAPLGCTDLHLSPHAHGFDIQARIAGRVQVLHVLPLAAGQQLISAIKSSARLNIAETRRPQDGLLAWAKQPVRVACHPCLHGEVLALRLLQRNPPEGLANLGLTERTQDYLLQAALPHHGLTLLTGPTGSGKTTLLHALLNQMGFSRGRVMTLEDPVEYLNPAFTQTDLSQLPHMTFVTGLKSLLRQDPDTMVVGEIRDAETAQLVVSAALTGHRVLSTLHAGSCRAALLRLEDLGIQSAALEETLNGLFNVRLNHKGGKPTLGVEHHVRNAQPGGWSVGQSVLAHASAGQNP